MQRLKGKRMCALCEGTGPGIEHDLRSADYQQMAQHVQPGVQGIRCHRSYQKLLKRHGLTDDIPTKEIAAMTVNTGFRERIKEEAIRRYVDTRTPQWTQRLAQSR